MHCFPCCHPDPEPVSATNPNRFYHRKMQQNNFDFLTTEDLLNNEWINGWKIDKELLGEDVFYAFVKDEDRLLATYNEGFKWYNIGTLKYPDSVDLPEWTGGRYHVRMPDGTETIIGSDQIRFTHGNTITLKDGTQVHNLWKEGKE